MCADPLQGLPMRSPMRGALFSQALDRGDGFENGSKKGCYAQPYASDIVVQGFRSWTRLRIGHFTNILLDIQLVPFGWDTGVIQGGRGAGIRPMTNDQPRTVMRNPMRDPMRDIDLKVLGDVGASTPLSSSTREHRIQFASRIREPASRLLPLMARTPSFEAQSIF